MSTSVHQNAVAPYAIRYDGTSEDAAYDLSTATSGRFDVEYSDGTTAQWTATLSNQTATTLRLTHVFVAGDVPNVEVVLIEPRVSTPAGEFVFEARELRVRAKYRT